jgi:hypothetical protein
VYRKLLLFLFTSYVVIVAATTAQGAVAGKPGLGAVIGGGNFPNADVGTKAVQRLKILERLGAHNCRVNLYPNSYLRGTGKWNEPNPRRMDRFLAAAHEHGVTPMILFEYYANMREEQSGLGSYEQWAAIGKAFAERCRPNGTWGMERGVEDWGVTVYAAFNEPEGHFGQGAPLPMKLYLDAIKGLADGVHSVDKSLRVIPGGFKTANSHNDWRLRGFGPALAPLWNNGTLDGIDLHTYFDVKYAPMEGHYADSSQSNFDAIKKACGIKRDICFYASEFNYKTRETTEEQAAKGFLTAIWDTVGVVGNRGQRIARLAFPWNIFHTSDRDPVFGMAKTTEPYAPTKRGAVLRMVLELTEGMEFVTLDPRRKGTFVLEGAGKKLWVWQNRKGWTVRHGSEITITGIPTRAKRLEIHGWDGMRRSGATRGRSKITITRLALGETHMFLAR